jgi:hypothetical protein
MALPPIISNFPLFKIFKPGTGGNAASTPAQTPAAPAAAPQDTVSISPAARNLDQINTITAQTRQILEQTPVALGLDPSFT